MATIDEKEYLKVVQLKKSAATCELYTDIHYVSLEDGTVLDPSDPIISGLSECLDENCCNTLYETITLTGDSTSGTIDLSGNCFNKFHIDNSNNPFDLKFTLSGNIDGSGTFWVRRYVAKGKEFDCPIITGMTYEVHGDMSDCMFPIDIELISDCSSKP